MPAGTQLAQLTKDEIAALRARLRAVITTEPKSVGQVIAEAGIVGLSSARVNWHLARVPGVEYVLDAEGLRWRLETTPDRDDNLTFFLQ